MLNCSRAFELKSGFIGVSAALILGGLAVATPAMAKACEPAPAPIRDIVLPRYYTDASGSEIDAEAKALHAEAVAPLTEFLRQIVKGADKAVAYDDTQQAKCALEWLETWARGGAWLGVMGSKQAEYQRKWDLGGVAAAYLKLKVHATPAKQRTIEGWLKQWADLAYAFQSDPDRQRNNQLYWLGFALGATAIATDSDRHWRLSRDIMSEAAKHIAEDGALALELERKSQALHYHSFAVTPLVALAEMAAQRGENWFELEQGALHRLVALTIAGLNKPAIFDELSGYPQKLPAGTGAGWLWLYGQRYASLLPAMLPVVPRDHRWLGGDVANLKRVLSDRRYAQR